MLKVFHEIKQYIYACKSENFAFYMISGYIIFSYLRPHVIYPALNFFPWTQAFIIGGLIYAISKKLIRFQSTHMSVLLFAFSCIISTFTSFDPNMSSGQLSTVFIWLLEVIFFTSCVTTRNQFRLAIILFFIVFFKISLFGAKTWIQRGFAFKDYGIAGPNGFFENSGELSLVMAMIVILSLSFLSAHKNVNKLYYLLPITAIMTVLAASSRGCQLALATGLILYFLIKGKFSIKYILAGMLIGYIGFQLLPEGQKKRFSSAGEDNTSVSRLTYWKAGLKMLDEHPIVGVGFRGFPEYFHKHYHYMIPEGQSWGMRREVAHNTMIEVLSELGIIGFIAYMYMYLLVFKLNARTRKMLRDQKVNPKEDWVYQFTIGLDVAQITFFIGAFFMSVALYPYTYFMLMFSGSLNNIVASKLTNTSHGGRPTRNDSET
jgi:putative inorganic carbon (hco3(-)) transporter